MTIFGDTETTDGGTGRSSLTSGDRRGLALIRISIGLAQGLVLYLLWRSVGTGYGDDAIRAWPATVPTLFAPLLLVSAFLPVVLLAGVGRLRLRTLAIWTIVAGVSLALLAWHDVARQSLSTLNHPPFLSFPMLAFTAAALFIAHHLVVPADQVRRRFAPFPAYFDTAWKAGVQLALSIGFTGAFWLLLILGAALFNIIGLKFLENLLRQEWFAIPVTTVAFSIAVQLTDVRDALIRGVRSVALMLLSWLLLVITVLVAGFLAALPFTGLDGLWDTGSATALVLAAAAALIILINTAYQDGLADNLPPAVLRVAVRVAAVLLSPLMIIAVWGLTLRIGQHGLTPDRIIAAACTVVGFAYAVGYGFAALQPFWRRGDWMRPLEPTNIATAILSVAVILALFSPLADPARLSVADQTARLARGAVTPDKFDYRFLRFESGRAGEAALTRLAASTNADIATRAKAAQAADRYVIQSARGSDVRAEDIRIRAIPEGAALPASFIAQYPRLREILRDCREASVCEARMLDLDRDGSEDVLLAHRTTVSVFKLEPDGRWFVWAEYMPPVCDNESVDIREAFATGRFETAAPVFPDLIVNGIRLRHQEGTPECPAAPDPR
ncbi:DUF4153 domain-containing protein [uncultured Brevundimonas sp.]|uniref:DUF4153 domain-containing protein n=1 Tax=uncultured Brevundimonas sp. TaxID=213418 RepID=UPI0030ED80C0|tara:strand:- start:25698 stop:27536 length:1839 start_codon:yes stop_codon:yes gene_type:complete